MVRFTGQGHTFHLVLDEGSHHDEGTEGQDDQGQLPAVHEADDDPSQEGGGPLEADPHLVPDAHLDLVDIPTITGITV